MTLSNSIFPKIHNYEIIDYIRCPFPQIWKPWATTQPFESQYLHLSNALLHLIQPTN